MSTTAVKSPTTPDAIDWRALLISSLGLMPVEGETEIPDDAITARLGEVVTAVGTATDASTRLAALQEQFDQVRLDLDAKSTELTGLYQAKTEAEVDLILEEFAARLTTPESQARIRALLLSDRESGMDILKGLPDPAVAAVVTTEATPPGPMHDPAAQQQTGTQSEAERLTAQNALVSSIRKETRNGTMPFASFDAARNEARRRQPDLFA